MNAAQIKKEILELANRYSEALPKEAFVPGKSMVPVSGRVCGQPELRNLMEASMDLWLTVGRFNETFEKELARVMGVKHVLTVNSGSSANLLAVAALTSPLLKERALKRGDEVITVAASFPTTVNPLLFYGLTPVFVDTHIPTYNPLYAAIEKAVTPKTKAIILAHTLGNPFEAARLKTLADKHGLWLIEDCCDALGSVHESKHVGTFGHIGTLSFYPAHHITMGEGGAVFTSDPLLKRILESFRDWGRDCWCHPGKDNTCGKRFGWQLGDLPQGYDHKYIYSHAGFNLKITDMQAAVGLAQLERLEGFIRKRRENFKILKDSLGPYQDVLELPEATQHSEPSWFGFPITVKKGAPFSRNDLTHHLEQNRIQTRLLFAGNITRQPYFSDVDYKISGNLEQTDRVMSDTFWLGVYPGLTEEMLNYVTGSLAQFIQSKMLSK